MVKAVYCVRLEGALGECFISKVANDISPAVGTLDRTFTLIDTPLTTTLVTLTAHSSDLVGWGFTMNGNSLYLG
ncbi:MAG: hypothetical protein ACI4P8_05895 [Akkermansia sp.]